jgi:magnesium and cobalt transporter
MSIGEASDAIGSALPEGEYDSVAGLLYSRLGVVPRQGDELDLDEITFIVDELDGHRIRRVRAVRRTGAGTGDGSAAESDRPEGEEAAS